MGIRNNLLGVGSVGITTETRIIIGATVVKIVLVVQRIAWWPDRMLAAAGIVCREKGITIGAFEGIILKNASPIAARFARNPQ